MWVLCSLFVIGNPSSILAENIIDGTTNVPVQYLQYFSQERAVYENDIDHPYDYRLQEDGIYRTLIGQDSYTKLVEARISDFHWA